MSVGIAASEPVRHCEELLRIWLKSPEQDFGLVIGCGSGDELSYLRKSFGNRRIIGLDIATGFSSTARVEGGLINADAKQLPFRNAQFAFAVAIHSLEHVGNPDIALREIQRILVPGGMLYVGVPNRSRLIGYLGSFDASFWQKVKWNLIDYWAKLRGRFRNELGAHAGFEGKELLDLIARYFVDEKLLTGDYLRRKYSGRIPVLILNILLSPALIKYSATAHYVICRKGPE